MTSTAGSVPSGAPRSWAPQDAVQTGELPATTDPELLADALVGPILLRRLIAQPVGPEIAPALVDQLLPASAL